MKLPRSRLSHAQTDCLLEHFIAATPARPAAARAGVNRNSARLFYHRLRELIARRLGQGAMPLPHAEAGAGVFALVADGGALRAAPRPEAGERLEAWVRLRSVHARRVLRAADLRFEGLPACSARAEEFWHLAQRLLRAYNGVPREHLHLFLAECEWRLGCGTPRSCLHQLRHWLARP